MYTNYKFYSKITGHVEPNTTVAEKVKGHPPPASATMNRAGGCFVNRAR